MTIYKPNKQAESKVDKKSLPLQVVTEQMLLEKGNANNNDFNARLVIIRNAKRRSAVFKACAVILFLFLVLFSLGCGLIVYRHIINKPFMASCQVRYTDAQKQMYEGSFNEQIEIDSANGVYEKLEVPAIMDFRRSTVVHDFERNLTAIVDRDRARCYVLPLNRTVIKPPQNFMDMIHKFQSGYYLPNAEILHENYRVATPRVEDMQPFGYYIYMECKYFDTYRLVRDNQPFAMSKRSSPLCPMSGNSFCLGAFDGYMPCLQLTACN
jgi:hypothetical protein